MKHILLFGAGKSATVLIDYLKDVASEQVWKITIADNNLALAQSKVGEHPLAKAVQVNIENELERKELIQQAHLVISMMPPALHYLIALDCLALSKHLLTASYVDEQLKELSNQIENKDILFLCEMGLDPGIDHMSAMQLIHNIKKEGGKITSFKSHCGGLIAPESDDNPWHYKISWNPRNIIMAGKSGAIFKENNQIKNVQYQDLFNAGNTVKFNEDVLYSFYANRDSLSYISLYQLEEASTFIRTTLRHPEFMIGWKNIVDLKLTDEEKVYQTDGMTVAQFFGEHFEKNGFSKWLNEMLTSRLAQAKEMMEKLMALMEAEEEAEEKGDAMEPEFMMVNEKGELNNVNVEDIKDQAAITVAAKMHEANLSMNQLFFLGMDDTDTVINKGLCSAADVLQFLAENKLALQPTDKDMIVMLHEIEFEKVNGNKQTIKSSLVVKGENSLHTAMAKTVGLPLGIAAKLILEEKITTRGLHIPTIPSIYEAVLKELKLHGIFFTETIAE